MARGLPTTRGRAGHSLAVLAFALLLNGPAWAAAPAGLIAEVEPNDTTGTAQALPSTPVRVRGDIYRFPVVAGTPDVDVYSFTAAAGDRVYAATMTAFSSGDQDTRLDIIDINGTTVLESDNDDGAIGVNASNVGGTLLVTGGTYFVRVRPLTTSGSLGSTIRPYDLYLRVLSATPVAETEPNNSSSTATPLPANGWVSGVVGPRAGDIDFFALAANAGDTIIAILDADPERDVPEWNPRLAIGVFNGFILAVDGSVGDPNPSEALMMTVQTAGTYVVSVDPSPSAPGGAAGNTYNLSVSVIPATTRTCTSYPGTGGTIADVGTTDFNLAIGDLRTIDTLQLSLNATHPLSFDLDVSLLSPDGNEVVLFDDSVTSAVAPEPQINLTLDDEAALPISLFVNLFPPLSGMHYAPESTGRLAYFKGMQAQGMWTLRVRDGSVATSQTGTINSWSLNVCEAAPREACVDPGPAETTVLSTDFETGDTGFTHAGAQDEWQRGLPAFAPILTAHSGTNAFKTDLAGTYNAGANFDLQSPTIDLTTVTGRITLNWWQKYQMESASSDTYYVEVREVGVPANFRRLFSWTGAAQTRSVGQPAVTINQSAGWGLVQADISDFAGLNTEVRFHLESDGSVQLAGVAIDDVLVTACTTTLADLIFEDGFE